MTRPGAVAGEMRVFALPGLPIVEAGDSVAELVVRAVDRVGAPLADGDVVVVSSKIVSRAEGRFVDLSDVEPSPRAKAFAARVGKDARLVELILREASLVSRAAPGVLIVKSRLGVVGANAGIDQSNAVPRSGRSGAGPWVTLLPEDPDASARGLRDALRERLGVTLAVIVSDSVGRPFRLGSVGVAIGIAGLPPLGEHTGAVDLFGRRLEHTTTALADQIASAADLVAGQGAEGRGVVVVRGVRFAASEKGARGLVRDERADLYLHDPGAP